MRATITFKLPEEQSEYAAAMDGAKVFGALQEFDNYLRGIIKYTDQEQISVEEVRAKLHEYVNEAGTSVWDI